MSQQKLGIFSVQSQFGRLKINSIFMKMIFLSEYQIRKNNILKTLIIYKRNYLVKFLMAQHSFCLQVIKIFSEYIDSCGKISLILDTTARNLGTQQT